MCVCICNFYEMAKKIKAILETISVSHNHKAACFMSKKNNTQNKKNSQINGTFLRLMELINENKYRTYIFILLLTYKSFAKTYTKKV